MHGTLHQYLNGILSNKSPAATALRNANTDALREVLGSGAIPTFEISAPLRLAHASSSASGDLEPTTAHTRHEVAMKRLAPAKPAMVRTSQLEIKCARGVTKNEF